MKKKVNSTNPGTIEHRSDKPKPGLKEGRANDTEKTNWQQDTINKKITENNKDWITVNKKQ